MVEGAPVEELRLSAGSIDVAVLSFGAILRVLRFEGRPVTLGFDEIGPYARPGGYLGAIAGRYANRIADGRFTLAGAEYRLTRNEAGRTHLHGGMPGFSHRNWAIRDHDGAAATLELVSPDGEQGYPATLTARCTYRIVPPATLRIELTAEADRPTVVNLAAHSYFNLDGGPTIADHWLTVPADAYLPVTPDKIPTGGIAPVAGTPFDFRHPRRIGAGAYDHNFVVGMQPAREPREVARLVGPRSGVELRIASTEPGLQFYDGHMLDAAALPGLGIPLGRHAGLCLEPQRFPNSPNEPGFPSATLAPGETYRQVTEYRFGRVENGWSGDPNASGVAR